MGKNKFDIRIQGFNYTIVTEKSEEETKEIVKIVEDQINRSVKNNPRLNRTNALVLASMNITEEFYGIDKDFKAYRDRNDKFIEDYPRLKEAYEILKNERENLQKELEEKNSQMTAFKEKLISDSASEKISIIKSYEDKLSNSEKSVSQLKNDIGKLNKYKDELEADLESAKEKENQAQKAYNSLKNEYNNLLHEKKKLDNFISEYHKRNDYLE